MRQSLVIEFIKNFRVSKTDGSNFGQVNQSTRLAVNTWTKSWVAILHGLTDKPSFCQCIFNGQSLPGTRSIREEHDQSHRTINRKLQKNVRERMLMGKGKD